VAAQTAASAPAEAPADSEPVFILDTDPPAGDRPATGGQPAAAQEDAPRPLFARPPRPEAGPPAEEVVDVAAEIRRLIAGKGRGPSPPPPVDEIVFIE
jgi:hypothetical protein